MAGAVVQSTYANGTAGTGVAIKAFPVNNTAGNSIVVFVLDLAASGRTFTVTDQRNTYGAATQILNDTTTNTTMAVFTVGNIVGNSNTVTVTCTNGATDQVLILIAEISGVVSSPVDGSNARNQATPGTGTNAITSNGVSNTKPAFLLGLSMYTAIVGAPAITAGTGFTSVSGNNIAVQGWSGVGFGSNPARLEWQASVPAGTTSATFTDSSRGGVATYDTIAIALDESLGTTPVFIPAASVITTSGFTLGAWNTVGLSGAVPAGAKGAILNLSADASHTLLGLGLRPTGSTDTWQQGSLASCPVGSQQYRHVGLNSSLQFDCYPEPTSSFAGIVVEVVGYYGAEAVFLNAAIQLSAASTGSVNTYNAVTAGVPAGALGVILGFDKKVGGQFMVRQNGSSDDFSIYNTGLQNNAEVIVGIDSSGIFQLKTSATAPHPYIVGYFPSSSNLVWNPTAVDHTPIASGSSQALPTHAASVAYLYQVSDGISYTIVSSGGTGLPQSECTGGSMGQASCGPVPTANISTLTGAHVLELAYFGPVAGPVTSGIMYHRKNVLYFING